MAVATWFDIGPSLILAGVNAVVAFALIGFSLSLLITIVLMTQCACFTAALTHLNDRK